MRRTVAAASDTPLDANRGKQGLDVAIDRVSRSYGGVAAVADVSLQVEAGEFVSLLGPSGSGKTTLLMMLAGFEEPDAGSISIGGRDVTHVAPNKRGLAMVFQRYALFPHMSVAENVAFPLAMRKVRRSEQASRVAQALDKVQLAGYGERKPAELSGGQQQRVALARAIVFEPPVVLMDEPLGALDKKLRQDMQLELKQLQQRLGATFIYVTHDQEEALTMSDRVAVMSEGRLRQVGSPRALYDEPTDVFVADFIGQMNILPGILEEVSDGLCRVSILGDVVPARLAAGHTPPRPGQRVRVAVRPEALTLAAHAPSGAAAAPPGVSSGGLSVKVGPTVFNGATLAVHLTTHDGTALVASLNPALHGSDLVPGRDCQALWAPKAAIIFGEGA